MSAVPGQFLVSWSTGIPYSVRSTRLGATGAPMDPGGLILEPAPYGQGNVLSASSDGVVHVVGVGTAVASPVDPGAARYRYVSTSGAVFDVNAGLALPGFASTLAFDGERILVAGNHGLQFMKPDAGIVAGPFPACTPVYGTVAAASFDGRSFLVLTLSNGLSVCRVDRDGGVVDTHPVPEPPQVWGSQSTIASAANGRSLVGWVDQAGSLDSRIRLRLLDTKPCPLGAWCFSVADCLSGFCVDGVCCDSACGGGSTSDCLACGVAAGGVTDGQCGLASASTVCRPSAGECDVDERCEGRSPACPADQFIAAGVVCRPAHGSCDLPEQCTGAAAGCPLDEIKDAGAACDDRNDCTTDDSCFFRQCQGVPVDAGTACDDHDSCTTGEVCLTYPVCSNGVPRNCPATDCASGYCDRGTGSCALWPLDGVACDGGRCVMGSCTAVADAGAEDAGVPDAGSPGDAGNSDAGGVDAGQSNADSGTTDAGAPDAGVHSDAGSSVDGGAGPGEQASGCGCSSPASIPEGSAVLGLLLVMMRRGRRSNWRAERSR